MSIDNEDYCNMLKKIFNNVVFKNFSYLTIGTVISQIISLVTVLKITSILSPDDYGLFTFLIAQGMLLIRIGDLGNRNIVIRTIARKPEKTNDLIVNGAIMRIIALLALSVLYVIYNYYFGSLSSEYLILLFVFSLVNCLSTLFELVFHGNQKMLPSTIINLCFSIFWFFAVFFLMDKDISVGRIFSLYIAVNLVKSLLYLFFLKYYKLLNGKVQGFLISSKELIKESWPYFAMILILLPLTSLSNNFLDINSTTEEIGYFNLSDRLIGPLSLIVGMALSALFPNLSALWRNDNEKFNRFLSVGIGLYILVAMLGCFFFSLFSKEVVEMLFPKGYLPAIEVCQVQVWYLFFTAVDSLIGVVLGAANKEKLILRFSILYFIICTPALFYGSKFGALGLSYGYVLSYGIGLVYVWHTFKRVLRLRIKYDRFIWILAIGLFGLTQFGANDIALPYKFFVCIILLAILGPYILKIYKPLLLR